MAGECLLDQDAHLVARAVDRGGRRGAALRPAGLVSLCQYALLGAGGWIALRAGHGLGWPFELSVLAGGLLSCIVGMLAGLPALRLRGFTSRSSR
jgi:ABC-type branched-subunit amino acid transport system permease subunit